MSRPRTAKAAGLRTKFAVKRIGEVVHIKIKTRFSSAVPRTYKCSKGQEKRCRHSKGNNCTCACKGHNHGTKRRWPKILKWR